MWRTFIYACFLSLFTFCAVLAHDAWIEKKENQLVVMYGHGSDTETYDASKVKEVKAYDREGKIIPVEAQKEGYPVTIKSKGEASLITMVFDNGYWVNTKEGWKNKSKKEEPNYTESVHSIKYGKTFLGWSDKLAQPIGMKMEVVPLKNLSTIKSGDILTIKVLLEGKPLEDAIVNAGGYHKEEIKTNKEGMAEIKIEKPGFLVVTASKRIPLKDNPDADMMSLSANMAFEVQ